MLLTEYERVIDTCYASKGEANISVVNPGVSGYLVVQINRVIDGPCLIYIGRDDNLAVEMGSFYGIGDNGVAELRWVTESEHENRGFRLLRRNMSNTVLSKSAAAIDTAFALIADYSSRNELMGKLTTQLRSEYCFIDQAVALGKTYEYALEAVDINGNVERYPTTVVVTVDKLFVFELGQNFPNPFNPSTVIKYSVPGKYSVAKKLNVVMSIHDIRGRLVKTLLFEEKLPGNYTIGWNGKANNGRIVSSGIYFYKIEVRQGKYQKVRKMTVVK